MLTVPAFAATSSTTVVGGVEFRAILLFFGSPMGLALGLIVTVFGIWSFFVSQKFVRGLILCALGVAISCFPAIFSGVRQNLYPFVTDIGGSGGSNDFSQFVEIK